MPYRLNVTLTRRPSVKRVGSYRWRYDEPQCKGVARTRCPRRCDGSSAVRPRGNRALLAGMVVPVDLLWGGSPHDEVPRIW